MRDVTCDEATDSPGVVMKRSARASLNPIHQRRRRTLARRRDADWFTRRSAIDFGIHSLIPLNNLTDLDEDDWL